MRGVALLTIVLAASPAFADDGPAGVYDVKFEEAGTTCNPPPVALGRGKLTIEVKKGTLSVNTDLIPVMYGTPDKSGKIAAKTPKLVGTTVMGLSARYSVAGRVDSGMLQLVLTADYVRQDTNKPYCQQAWNISGVRGDAAKKD
ncbi:MAG TPA: hypothetical protein VMJ10_33895 [Kofleriaceae bacterium]|nr:hypothetical protein [Kofleriaceae bacterium]